jgi:hypothetical protein
VPVFPFEQFGEVCDFLLAKRHARAKWSPRTRYLIGAVKERCGDGAFNQFTMIGCETLVAERTNPADLDTPSAE